MAKTKTKGTTKTVSDTPVPQPITISSTNPKIMADNIKKLEKAIKGADDASEISYDNTASHLTASNVQAAIDEVVTEIGSITSPTASDVSYDNTDSGLTADDVQDAINEVLTKFIPISSIVAGNVVEFGTFNVTSGSDNIPVTGIKVTTTVNSRYCIFGIVLSGSVKSNHFVGYSSWTGAIIDVTPV